MDVKTGVKMTAEELTAFLAEIFPQIASDFVIDEVGERRITVRLLVEDRHLRPGGTVSGPSTFALADVAVCTPLREGVSTFPLEAVYAHREGAPGQGRGAAPGACGGAPGEPCAPHDVRLYTNMATGAHGVERV